MKIIKLGLLSFLSTFLTDCDSEPSQLDIEKAFQQKNGNTNDQLKSLLSKINSVEKISCNKKSSGDYNCIVDIDIKLPMTEQKKSVAEFELVKYDRIWKIVK